MKYEKPKVDSHSAGFRSGLHANLALSFVEKWGMVQGASDGTEDSAGRAKLVLMPVEEVVNRAASMAEQIVAELERREWISPSVPFEEYAKLTSIYERARYSYGNEEKLESVLSAFAEIESD